MIPQALGEWTVESVRRLLELGAHEGDRFELKEALPHSKDEAGKDRLRKTCAAFANSFGGFIIFGVKDQRDLPAAERLAGIEPGQELPRDFGNFPAVCHPSVDWTFLNVPLKLANGNVLHVIEIAKSARRPHAVGRVDNGWFFPKRTNKGNEGMSFDEIRDAFAANAAVDQHLDALDGELRVNIQVWQEQRNRLPNPTLNATMSRALEDFLRTPFLKNVISVSDVSILWQQTKAISALASWLMQPLQTQEVVEAGLKEIAKELDGAIARCVKVREQIASARDLLG